MQKTRSKISVCIITNESNPQLISTILSYADAVDEICLGVNGHEIDMDYIRTHTQQISHLKIYPIDWIGYGQTKNHLQNLAENDWILSVDADERSSDKLNEFLKTFHPISDKTVYEFRLVNHLGNYAVKFGAWGNGKKFYSRLFNRQHVHWNDAHVHEKLIFSPDVLIEKVHAEILHFSADNIAEVRSKNTTYAKLSAEVKFIKGKKASCFRKYSAAVYTFIKEYIVQLGFLDGYVGFLLARENAIYSYKKYLFLYEKMTESRT